MTLGAALFLLVLIPLALFIWRKQPIGKTPPLVGLSCALFTAAWMGYQWHLASSLPGIHDISTDLDNPPAFDKIRTIRGQMRGINSLDRKDTGLAAKQRAAYPCVRPLEISTPMDRAFVQALQLAENLGWEPLNVATESGLIEASDTTFWFGFIDDIAIRVQATASGSRIDLRSVSRVGRSDIGKNARRICQFLEAWTHRR